MSNRFLAYLERERRNTIILSLVALAFYVGFIVMSVMRA